MKVPVICALMMCATLTLPSKASAHAVEKQFVVVDFATCVQQSKFGKREQQTLEEMKKQMGEILSRTEKQLNELVAKLQDQDYVDSLSVEGEQKLKYELQMLSEQFNRSQQQYYQILQQANMRMLQNLAKQINTAAESLAVNEHIPLVLNKEIVFYHDPQLEMTSTIIERMNKEFEIAESKNELPATSNEQLLSNLEQILGGSGALR